jgi:hypothetical protein
MAEKNAHALRDPFAELPHPGAGERRSEEYLIFKFPVKPEHSDDLALGIEVDLVEADDRIEAFRPGRDQQTIDERGPDRRGLRRADNDDGIHVGAIQVPSPAAGPREHVAPRLDRLDYPLSDAHIAESHPIADKGDAALAVQLAAQRAAHRCSAAGDLVFALQARGNGALAQRRAPRGRIKV